MLSGIKPSVYLMLIGIKSSVYLMLVGIKPHRYGIKLFVYSIQLIPRIFSKIQKITVYPINLLLHVIKSDFKIFGCGNDVGYQHIHSLLV